MPVDAGTLEAVAFLQWLRDACGYRDVRPLPGGRWAGIAPFMFTHAIITGRIADHHGYDDRWCYHGYAATKAALDAWDGTGEPRNWHRHPATGRRVSPEGVEYVAF